MDRRVYSELPVVVVLPDRIDVSNSLRAGDQLRFALRVAPEWSSQT